MTKAQERMLIGKYMGSMFSRLPVGLNGVTIPYTTNDKDFISRLSRFDMHTNPEECHNFFMNQFKLIEMNEKNKTVDKEYIDYVVKLLRTAALRGYKISDVPEIYRVMLSTYGWHF